MKECEGKVLHLIAPVSFGGGEKIVFETVKEFNKKGLRHELLLLNESKLLENELRKNMLIFTRTLPFDFGYAPSKSISLLCLILQIFYLPLILSQANKFNIIHCHGFPANVLGFFLKILLKRKKIKFIHTLHSTFGAHGVVQRFIFSRIFGSFDFLCFVSMTSLNSFSKNYPRILKNSNSKVLYNFIDDDFFQRSKIQKVVDNNRVVVTQIGRLSAIKRHDLTINALVRLDNLSLQSPVEYWVIGEGPTKGSIISMESTLNEHKVKLKLFGQVDRKELITLLDMSHISVFPNPNEGFCIAAVEALSRDNLILAYDCPVYREVLGNNAIYFEESSYADVLHFGLSQIKDQKGNRRKAIEGDVRRFAKASYIAELIDIYEKV